MLSIFNPFLWDKDVYQFNRLEKDMRPYSVHSDTEGNEVTLVHNVVGINKKDLSVKVVEEDGVSKSIKTSFEDIIFKRQVR